MVTVAEMAQWFRKAFNENQPQMLAEAVVRLTEAPDQRHDFTQLNAIVDRIAARTERIKPRKQGV